MINKNAPINALHNKFGVTDKGLTKREYFAAMAMQGIIAADINTDRYPEDVARYAVQQADALLKELEE